METLPTRSVYLLLVLHRDLFFFERSGPESLPMTWTVNWTGAAATSLAMSSPANVRSLPSGHCQTIPLLPTRDWPPKSSTLNIVSHVAVSARCLSTAAAITQKFPQWRPRVQQRLRTPG
jgi:hypothetical protein